MTSWVILPLLPIYIFGIFLNMTHSGQVFSILMVFIKIIGVIFLLHIFLLVFQYCIAALFVRRNPFKLLGKMLPAYFTALGTVRGPYYQSQAFGKVIAYMMKYTRRCDLREQNTRRSMLVKDVKNVETAVGVLQEIVAMQVEEG